MIKITEATELGATISIFDVLIKQIKMLINISTLPNKSSVSRLLVLMIVFFSFCWSMIGGHMSVNVSQLFITLFLCTFLYILGDNIVMAQMWLVQKGSKCKM